MGQSSVGEREWGGVRVGFQDEQLLRAASRPEVVTLRPTSASLSSVTFSHPQPPALLADALGWPSHPTLGHGGGAGRSWACTWGSQHRRTMRPPSVSDCSAIRGQRCKPVPVSSRIQELFWAPFLCEARNS